MNSLENFVTSLVIVLLFCIAADVKAQSLVVTLSPNSSSTNQIEGGVDQSYLLANFRFDSAGGMSTVTGLSLSLGGTADWVNWVSASDGVQIWLDNGDGVFNVGSDSSLGAVGAVLPKTTVTLNPTLSVQSGVYSELWIRIHLLSISGGSIAKTFDVSLASASDIAASGGVAVSLGTPAPVSAELSIIQFYVSSCIPGSGFISDVVTIVGSGFSIPLSATLDGTPFQLTPVISADGTTITGLRVPNLGPIAGLKTLTVTTSLGSKSWSQSFDYLGPRNSGSSHDPGESGCTSTDQSDGGTLCLAACLAVLSIPALHRLRRRALGSRSKFEA